MGHDYDGVSACQQTVALRARERLKGEAELELEEPPDSNRLLTDLEQFFGEGNFSHKVVSFVSLNLPVAFKANL